MKSLRQSREECIGDVRFTVIANDNNESPVAKQTLKWHYISKRLFDIILSLIAIIVLSPLLFAVAILIKMDSKGPSLLTQVRWGADGRKINVFKFRSMYVDKGDATGVAQTIVNDPRITPVRRVIRGVNIDELPQLINILKGDMSIVGPRCHAVGMLAAGTLYEDLVPTYHQRHMMRPGLTGLAQARGWRGPTDTPAKARSRIACDLYYIENFSIWLDFHIILSTFRTELTDGRGF